MATQLSQQLNHLICKHGDHEFFTALAQVFADSMDRNKDSVDEHGAAEQIMMLCQVAASVMAHAVLLWPPVQATERRTYAQYGINWIHYLCGDFNDVERTVTIKWEDRFHKYDNPKHPEHITGVEYRTKHDEHNRPYVVIVEGVSWTVLNDGKSLNYYQFMQLQQVTK